MMRILLQTFSIMGRSISQFELRNADVVIRPRLAGVPSADFSARKRTIQAGRDAALAALPEIRAKLAGMRRALSGPGRWKTHRAQKRTARWVPPGGRYLEALLREIPRETHIQETPQDWPTMPSDRVLLGKFPPKPDLFVGDAAAAVPDDGRSGPRDGPWRSGRLLGGRGDRLEARLGDVGGLQQRSLLRRLRTRCSRRRRRSSPATAFSVPAGALRTAASTADMNLAWASDACDSTILVRSALVLAAMSYR